MSALEVVELDKLFDDIDRLLLQVLAVTDLLELVGSEMPNVQRVLMRCILELRATRHLGRRSSGNGTHPSWTLEGSDGGGMS